MTLLTGTFAACSLLVALAGAFKLARPLPTVLAIRPFVRSVRADHIRLLGVIELGLGVSAAIVGGPPLAAAIGALYAAFAGFVIAVRRQSTTASCGCFGAPNARASRVHVIINVAAAGVAATAAVVRAPGLADALPDQPFLTATVVAVYVLYRVLVAAPRRERPTVVAGVTPAGKEVAVPVAGAGAPPTTVLVFLSSTCVTCHALWEALGQRHLDTPAASPVVIVTKGAEGEDTEVVRRLAPKRVTTVMASATWDAYRVPGAPYAILVDGSSGAVVSEATATTWPELRHHLERASAKTEPVR